MVALVLIGRIEVVVGVVVSCGQFLAVVLLIYWLGGFEMRRPMCRATAYLVVGVVVVHDGRDGWGSLR